MATRILDSTAVDHVCCFVDVRDELITNCHVATPTLTSLTGKQIEGGATDQCTK